jgi:hypothetical protein
MALLNVHLRFDKEARSRRVSAVGRFAEVKEEAAALGCAGGHEAKRPAALTPQAHRFSANAGCRQGPELLSRNKLRAAPSVSPPPWGA